MPPPSPSSSTRVVIIDDHVAIRESLAAILGSEPGLMVGAAVATAAEALPAIDEAEADVAIVDISLEEANGLDLIRTLHAERPGVRILVFSMFDETVYAERALQLGASGYLMKRSASSTLTEAIRAVAKGQIYVSHRIAARMLARYIRPSGFSFELDALTEREQTVLRMLGEGHAVDEIAGALGLQRKTVETYRRRAKEKLGFDSVSDLLQYAVERNLRSGQGSPAE